MTQFLPANLLALFSARPPIPFKPPVDRLKKRKNTQPIFGIAAFLPEFEQTAPPPATRGETREEREERKQRERKAVADTELEEKIVKWDPHSDPNATGDPFKTLFIGRINYDTSENKLRRELEAYGPVRRIHLVYNATTRKPRGYAFVEFEHERDMHSAYKHIDGKRIDNRRIVVDVERGRTVKSWRPRWLGGGLGGTRRGGESENIKHSGRVENWENSRNRDRGDRERGERERGERERGERERERERGERDRGERERERKRSRSPRDDKDRERRRREREERDGDRDRRVRGERRGRDREERDPEREREKKDRGDRDAERDPDRERDKKDRGDRDAERDPDRERERKDRGDRDPERERERRDRGERDRDRSRDEYRSSREEDGEIGNDEEHLNNDEQPRDEKEYASKDYERSSENRYESNNGIYGGGDTHSD